MALVKVTKHVLFTNINVPLGAVFLVAPGLKRIAPVCLPNLAVTRVGISVGRVVVEMRVG